MDIDADTSGYNLQAVFSTGYIASEEAALRCKQKRRAPTYISTTAHNTECNEQ
jgi:hypothetical protein